MGSLHRCTGVENPGKGVRDVFAKIPRGGGGGQGFQEKLPGGGPPILGFIAFLLTSFSKICLVGCCFIPPSPPCVHLCGPRWLLKIKINSF